MMINSKKVKEILENDGVIAFVTDTVWGLGCLPTSKLAVKRIYEIKHRDSHKPLILMSNGIEPLRKYVKPLTEKAEELVKKHFAGALTLVIEKSELTPDYITSGLNTVGIRVPDNKIFAEICSCIDGNVLATTSANLSHQPSAKTYEQALENMSGLADLIISDYGHICKGLESTVVGVFSDEEDMKIFRQGAITISI